MKKITKEEFIKELKKPFTDIKKEEMTWNCDWCKKNKAINGSDFCSSECQTKGINERIKNILK